MAAHCLVLGVVLAIVIMAPLLAAPGAEATEAVHHVVGGDRGWDVGSNVLDWSSGRVFRVGDCIWFAYSVGRESVVELGSKEEFENCDLSNPVMAMHQDGINDVLLEGEGSRYFASGRLESCRGGLKLHVSVLPYQGAAEGDFAPKATVLDALAPSSVFAPGATSGEALAPSSVFTPRAATGEALAPSAMNGGKKDTGDGKGLINMFGFLAHAVA